VDVRREPGSLGLGRRHDEIALERRSRREAREWPDGEATGGRDREEPHTERPDIWNIAGGKGDQRRRTGEGELGRLQKSAGHATRGRPKTSEVDRTGGDQAWQERDCAGEGQDQGLDLLAAIAKRIPDHGDRGGASQPGDEDEDRSSIVGSFHLVHEPDGEGDHRGDGQGTREQDGVDGPDRREGSDEERGGDGHRQRDGQMPERRTGARGAEPPCPGDQQEEPGQERPLALGEAVRAGIGIPLDRPPIGASGREAVGRDQAERVDRLAPKDELIAAVLGDRLRRWRRGADDRRLRVRLGRIGLAVLVFGQGDQDVAVHLDGDQSRDDPVPLRLAQGLDPGHDQVSGLRIGAPADAGVVGAEKERDEAAQDDDRGDRNRSAVTRKQGRHGPKVADGRGEPIPGCPATAHPGSAGSPRRRRVLHDGAGTILRPAPALGSGRRHASQTAIV
jgi:hypothetical protein